MAEYLPVLVFLAMIVAFGGVEPRCGRPGATLATDTGEAQSYECGPEPVGPAWIRFPVGFYLVALVFIVFDALVVFLFPWALVLRALGWAAFGPMVLLPRLILWTSAGSTPTAKGSSRGDKAADPGDPAAGLGRRSRTSRSG